MRPDAKNCQRTRLVHLKAALHLAEGSQVLLAQNISAPLGLVNGTTGAVQYFAFAADAEAPSPPGACLGRLWRSVQERDLLCGQSGAQVFDINLSGDQPAHNADDEDFLLLERRGLPLHLCWA
jgi:hypothetical protein